MDQRKKLFWSLFSLLLAVLSVWAVVSQSGELSAAQLIESVRDADKLWLTAAVLCGGLFIFLEGAAICSILKELGYRRNLGRGLLYSASDIYFSAVTPSATGGQPASAFFMVKDRIPAGAVTVTLLVNLIMYTVSIVVLGLGSMALHFRLLSGFRLMSRLLIAVGFATLVGLTAFFFAMLRHGGAVFGAAGRLLGYLHRKGIIRELDTKLAKLEKTREDFDACAKMTRGKTGAFRKAFVWNLGQRASQIAVPMCLHMAMGGQKAAAGLIFASQCLITIGYNCVPIPGGMGVADYLMLDGFSALMGRDEAFRLELLSRGISFYICAAAGGAITLVGYLSLRKKRKEKYTA